MSILYESDLGFIISHLKFFENIKILVPPEPDEATGSNQNDSQYSYLTLNPDLFEITEPFKDIKEKSAKRCKKTFILSEETKLIKTIFENLLSEQIPKEIFQSVKNIGDKNSDDNDCENEQIKPELYKKVCSNGGLGLNNWPKSNFTAVHTCQKFFEAVKTLELPHFHGQNPIPDTAVISRVATSNTHKFVFPPSTKFYCNDVMNMKKVLEENEAPFDLIVMDPPWWNKFIRRRKRKQHEAGYEMIDTDLIAKLPIDSILNENGMLIVWCTNAKSHQEKLIKELFPCWGIKHEKTLYWLKVTKSGTPICPFNEESKKQPYEIIIIGRKINLLPETGTQTASMEHHPKLVISVPSSINSHKPPIIDVIQKMYPDKFFDRKLEIFARYLVPGFISYGNEVVKLQHESLYIQQS